MHKSKILTSFFIASCLIFSCCAWALDDSSYAVGRYWGYDSVEESIDEIQENPKPVEIQVAPAPSAIDVMASVTQLIDEAKAKAVLSPTIENVKSFIALKNKAGDMATKFSVVWQEVLLQNAQLDYSAFKPTNNQALITLNKAKRQKMEKFLAYIAQKNGLVYFYEGADDIAQLQAPIITRLASKYGFDVLGVSMDGSIISELEHNSPDNGQAKRMGVQKVPALYSLNTQNGQFMPLSHTMLAEVELEQRLFDVFSHYEDWK